MKEATTPRKIERAAAVKEAKAIAATNPTFSFSANEFRVTVIDRARLRLFEGSTVSGTYFTVFEARKKGNQRTRAEIAAGVIREWFVTTEVA